MALSTQLSDQLVELDARIDAVIAVRHSLDPARERATPLARLGERMMSSSPRTDWQPAIGALTQLAAGQLDHFPNNLLWDLDYAAGAITRAPGRGIDVTAMGHKFVQLQARYGQHSPIRFRYVHDFVYGFDWERWVRKNPPERAHVLPHDPAFLDRSLRRADQLEQAIASGTDSTYPPLPPEQFRNPFGFTRSPHQELALHRKLAEEDLIPVPAWRFDGTPRSDRPYSALRTQCATDLGFALEGN